MEYLPPQPLRLPGRLTLQHLPRNVGITHQQRLVKHHILLARLELPLRARTAALRLALIHFFDEWRGIPLLQAAFWFRAVEPEEQNVLFCDFGGQVLGVLQFGGQGGEVVAYPAGTFGVCHFLFLLFLVGMES